MLGVDDALARAYASSRNLVVLCGPQSAPDNWRDIVRAWCAKHAGSEPQWDCVTLSGPTTVPVILGKKR